MNYRRWVVTGTRFGRFDTEEQLDQCAVEFGRPNMIFVGCAAGIDTQTRQWARRRGIPVEVFEADWETFGNAAGPIRNEAMIDSANSEDLCISLPAPNKPNRGTNHCMKYAHHRGLRVIER